MKMRTKILSTALFAAILSFTMAPSATERMAFALTAPTSALLDASLSYAGEYLSVAQDDARFVRLAQR